MVTHGQSDIRTPIDSDNAWPCKTPEAFTTKSNAHIMASIKFAVKAPAKVCRHHAVSQYVVPPSDLTNRVLP